MGMIVQKKKERGEKLSDFGCNAIADFETIILYASRIKYKSLSSSSFQLQVHVDIIFTFRHLQLVLRSDWFESISCPAQHKIIRETNYFPWAFLSPLFLLDVRRLRLWSGIIPLSQYVHVRLRTLLLSSRFSYTSDVTWRSGEKPLGGRRRRLERKWGLYDLDSIGCKGNSRSSVMQLVYNNSKSQAR